MRVTQEDLLVREKLKFAKRGMFPGDNEHGMTFYCNCESVHPSASDRLCGSRDYECLPTNEDVKEMLVSNYVENRANGDDSLSPDRPFPKDGNFYIKKRACWPRHQLCHKDIQKNGQIKPQNFGFLVDAFYDEGAQDRLWMEERDRNYVRSLAHKGVLHEYVQDCLFDVWHSPYTGEKPNQKVTHKWFEVLKTSILKALDENNIAELTYYSEQKLDIKKCFPKNCQDCYSLFRNFIVGPSSLLLFAFEDNPELIRVIKNQVAGKNQFARVTQEQSLATRLDDAIGSDDESDQLPSDFHSLKIRRGEWTRLDRQPLGQGSFGVVQAGRLSRSNQQIDIAIKSIPGDFSCWDYLA